MAVIQSGASADFLTIDPISKAARATLYDVNGNNVTYLGDAQPAVGSYSGFLSMGVNDRTVLPARMDRFGGLATAVHTPMLHSSFEGTTVNPILWSLVATTMTATQTTVGGLLFNSGNITTVNTGYMIISAKKHLKTQRCPLQAKIRNRVNHFNNSVAEFGFGDATTAIAAHTTGFFWRWNASGAVIPVVVYNSGELTGDDIRSSLNTANYYTWDVFCDDDEATFTCQDTNTGLLISKQSIKLPLTGQRLLSSSQLSAFSRLYNTATAPGTAPQMFLTDFYSLVLDVNQNKPWSHVMAGMERGFTGNPFTGAQLAQWANSAEPASATLSNTAAGYTTLGGKFQFAAVAGAVTDYALFGFQVPAPANLMITGCSIDTWNTGAAVATTPTLLTWALGVGSTAVSLATATVNRVGLGAQAFPVGAAIGAKAERIQVSFQSPLSVPSGRFLHAILRMPVGTATASQVIAGMVNFEGYFD